MLDYLFIGAHPDDCEIFVGGTILRLKEQGFRVGILDLTRGEMGSYGTVNTRASEIRKANHLMKLDFRTTLDFPDGKLENTHLAKEKVVDVLRETRAQMVFTFPSVCRHPDHQATHHIVKESIFLAGLKRFKTSKKLEESRPQAVAFFVEFYPPEKISFVMDITTVYRKKEKLVQCYNTQVIDKNLKEDLLDSQAASKESESLEKGTFIRSPAFWDDFEGRAKWFGSLAGVRFAEAFSTTYPPHLDHPLNNFLRGYV